VNAYDVAPEHGIFIAGSPGHPVRDLRLAGIQLHSRGGGTAEEALRTVPEMERDYPEPMLFGTLPSWGLYVRHAAGLQVRDVTLNLLNADARPALRFEDVDDADLAGLRLSQKSSGQQWVFEQMIGLRVRDCDGLVNS